MKHYKIEISRQIKNEALELMNKWDVNNENLSLSDYMEKYSSDKAKKITAKTRKIREQAEKEGIMI